MTNKQSKGGIVYSTDKTFNYEEEQPGGVNITPADQKLKVSLDKKQRAGKAVTIVEGYVGEGIDELGKKLKVYCGTGGSVKDGHIIIQGDNREKAMAWLIKNGFKNVKKV